jgi:putative restriction endonuclease
MFARLLSNGRFFFTRDEWIPVPSDWASNIVQGRGYPTDTLEGATLWKEVQARLVSSRTRDFGLSLELSSVQESRPLYEVQGRLGQGAFRVLVTDAYSRRCSITGERTLPALEAAHIVPYSVAESNEVSNGLLLRADMHNLFDQGLITVTPDYRVKVSPAIRERFENGRDYYAFQDAELRILPKAARDLPSRDRLDWHGREVFVRS